ncbi:CDP-glycerol glycerophosphotransferase family protein [Secundilactobacillus kimchicus]|uniref:CDP-glycerol glycerophosphotransferase family protein n=1 Tax=Secundilactobacillus kimchicus TaxID=528209 RepID=UPI0024A8A4CC|nr:CDP-glycerol glycerophosphotransferase family protein [Secundilactobacillus kimchicus]
MKDIYIWLVRLMSMLHYFNRGKHRRVIYLMSFDNNLKFILAVAKTLADPADMVVYYRPAVEAAATRLAAYGITVISYQDNVSFVLHGIPQMMRAKLMFCDNYYAFLGGLKHPRNCRIVQLWHANGAIKRFGFGDPKTALRSKTDQRRFQRVYNQFDDFVVASEAMGHVFEESYRVPASRIQLLGYPRSDRFLSAKWRSNALARVDRLAPGLTSHRVILFAPTYRESMKFELSDTLKKALITDPDAVVVVKLHPLLQQYEQKFSQVGAGRIRFYPQLSTTDLLMVTETLVTDYSSVAFDYSLLPTAHTMLFYMADLPEYEKNPGIQPHFLKWLPTQPLTTPAQLEEAIRADVLTDFTQFNHYWNTYNDGQATTRVIDHFRSTIVGK